MPAPFLSGILTRSSEPHLAATLLATNTLKILGACIPLSLPDAIGGSGDEKRNARKWLMTTIFLGTFFISNHPRPFWVYRYVQPPRTAQQTP
jgi:hypothetical protein